MTHRDHIKRMTALVMEATTLVIATTTVTLTHSASRPGSPPTSIENLLLHLPLNTPTAWHGSPKSDHEYCHRACYATNAHRIDQTPINRMETSSYVRLLTQHCYLLLLAAKRSSYACYAKHGQITQHHQANKVHYQPTLCQYNNVIDPTPRPT